MSEKKQFDEFLGGSEKIPDVVPVLKLASARANEIAAMTYNLENPQQTKLIFQKLPVHMRRRVMSHNAKRMPRKLRMGHLSQMKKSGLPPKTKRPSRKYRRRPQNLLLEYNRRQRNKFWLETHIWHAKRFKMITKWDYKLADYSNNRCFRANYRAVMKHCLIQDISYYTCIEISGPVEIVKEKLKMHCNRNEVTFGAKAFMSGDREGTVMFYKKDGYPLYPIGYVYYLWNVSDSDTKAIWIWLHPASYSLILEEIINNFDFNLKEDNNISSTKTDEIQDLTMKSPVENKSLPNLRIFLTNKIPVYINTSGCQLTILKNCLNRFRLCGPLTLSILSDAFKLPNIDSKFGEAKKDETFTEVEGSSKELDVENNPSFSKMDIDSNDKPEPSPDTWFKTYYQSQNNIETFKAQKDVFDKLRNFSSPNQLPPNMVLALTVLDPRFFLPEKRTKSLLNSEIDENILFPPPLINISPIWDLNILKYVTKNCMPTSAINNLRSQCLVPGVQNDEYFNENIMHKIPILFIQKPGDYVHNNNIGFSSGIDIVLPAGWSMPFWMALILRCARVGGLRETTSIAYENSNLNVPAIYHPDSNVYCSEAYYRKKLLIEKYFKRPPNKRVNYIKFGISSPFFCEWKLLMKEWNNVDNFYVLRDRNILSILKEGMSSVFKNNRKIKSKKVDKNNPEINLDDIVENKNCFVPIKVISENKGLPKDFAIICIPREKDLIKYKENSKWTGPMQSLKQDDNEKKRKELKNAHQKELKRLKRQRIRAKKKIEYSSSQMPVKDCREIKHLLQTRRRIKSKLLSSSRNIVTQQAQRMAELYLPKCTSVRHSCDREVIGYVTQGGFSFSEARGVGLGYVILSSVLNLIKEKSNIILVRNTTTRKFRVCRLKILN